MDLAKRKEMTLEGLRFHSRSFVKRAVFSRLLLIAALIVVQILIIVAIYRNASLFATQVFQAATSLIGVFLVIYIANRGIDPAFKLTWIIPMIAAPVVGVPLYFAVRSNLGARKARARVMEEIRMTARYIERDETLRVSLEAHSPEAAALCRYVEGYGYSTVYRSEDARYYASGEAMFEAALEAISRAKKFIFLEFFILDEGEMWDALLELLYKKAQEGVEVRLLYDGFGSLLKVPVRYEETLRMAGIDARVFCPVRPIFSTEQNNRDHRKILIIDGEEAFTGGINIADEYINVRSRFGHWKDAGCSMKGGAARAFTLFFLQNWNTAGPEKKGQPEAYAPYLVAATAKEEAKNAYCIPLADNPMDPEQVIETAYLDVINRAKKYVHITTPYLIIDSKMTGALTAAAKRGVDVALLLPHIPDKKAAFFVARSHYPELLEAGVRIYEYTPGFIHAKTFVSDDVKAIVGTSNLDFRSLYLHFECAAYFWDESMARDVERDFQKTVALSHEMKQADYEALSEGERFFGSLLRLFGPLM